MQREPTQHRLLKVSPRQDEWWRGAVIYQIYPRSFQDSNGDGIGDLPGILRRLPYVASLGVDAVWISPFFKSPMKDYGYDVADYQAVDPMFGSLADIDAIVAEAHRLDLKLLIDFVPSHTSNQHAWFLESRDSRDNAKADWYVWADPKQDGTPPNNWLSIFGGPAWEWEPRRGQYYLHNFLKEQPDLNFHNPAVINALMEAAQFWLDRGVDGFRVDAIDFGVHDPSLRDNPPRPAAEISTWDGRNPFNMQIPFYNKGRPELCDLFAKPLYRLTENYKGRMILGEISGDHAPERLSDYTSGGGLDLCYSFELMHAEPTPTALRRVIERQEAVIGAGWACWSFDNHDVDRAVTRFARRWGDSEALRQMIPVLLTCLKGSVCLYQGDELGLPQADIAYDDMRDPYGITFYPLFKGRDGSRTPMVWEAAHLQAGFSTATPWLPLGQDHAARAVDRQQADPASTLNRLSAFLRWRKRQPALVRGSIRFLDGLPGPVLGFIRDDGGQRLACFFNFGSAPQSLTPPAGSILPAVPGAGAHIEQGLLTLPGHGFGVVTMGA